MEPNYIITLEEYKKYKKGEEVQKLKDFWKEIKAIVINDLLKDIQESDFDLSVFAESDTTIRLKIGLKKPLKSLEEYIDSTLPLIICFKK